MSEEQDRAVDRCVSPEPTPDEQLSAAETRLLLERAIDALPDIYRTVFVLRDVEGTWNRSRRYGPRDQRRQRQDSSPPRPRPAAQIPVFEIRRLEPGGLLLSRDSLRAGRLECVSAAQRILR